MDVTPFVVPGVIAIMSVFMFTLMGVTFYSNGKK